MDLLIAVEGLDGSGKTTLAQGLADDLKQFGSTFLTRPARESIRLFREISGDDGKGDVLYQDVVPGPFRHMAYILEGAVQVRYLRDEYAAYDFLIFDRWRQTWKVYCGPVTDHAPWLERIGDQMPRPDLLFYVRVPPELAAE